MTALADSAKCEQTLTAAQQDFVNAHYADAIAKARTCTNELPGRAWRVVGASACFLKDRATAVEALGNLDPKGKSFVRYICKRNELYLP